MRLLSEGCRGSDVTQIQMMLNRLQDRGEHLKQDGIFGPRTKARVIEFQKARKLKVDGIVGEKTGSLLARSYVPEDWGAKKQHAEVAWTHTVRRYYYDGWQNGYILEFQYRVECR